MKNPVPGMWRSLAGPLSLDAFVRIAISASYGMQAWLAASVLLALIEGNALSFTLLCLVGVIALRCALLYLCGLTSGRLAALARQRLRDRLLAPLLSPDSDLSHSQNVAALRATLVEGVEALEIYYSQYLPALIHTVLGSLLLLALLGAVDPLSAGLLAPFVIALPLVDALWMRGQRKQVSGVFTAMKAFSHQLMDALQGISTLKVFNATAARRQRLVQQAAQLRGASVSALRVTLLRGGISTLIAWGAVATLLSLNGWRAAHLMLMPFPLLLSLLLAREIFRPAGQLEKALGALWMVSDAIPAVQTQLMTTPTAVASSLSGPAPSGYDIAFRDIACRYSGSDSQVLEQVSFTIPENGAVALTGTSGSGKSTIVNLLLRFLEPEHGQILLGGRDIRSLALFDLRQRIGLVSQQTFLFHGTLEDNLRFARQDASPQALWEAIEMAQLAPFVAKLPLGLQTPLGERGTQLSGGQRQRLAIARALLKKAPVLVMDEATASLDITTERAIEQALKSLNERCTRIVITHRLDTLRQADRILVLDGGRLVQAGSHQELSQREGRYRQLLAAQEEI